MEQYPMKFGDGDEVIESESAMLRDVQNGGVMNSIKSVRYIVVHCTGTREDCAYTVRQLRADHRARNFRDIGYHFYIRRDGSDTQHRAVMEVGAHCRPFNHCSIGVCYEGGIRVDGSYGDTRTEAQKVKLLQILRGLKQWFPEAMIVGHRDLPGTTPKECPCFDTRKWLAEVAPELM
jgi:N-acetyl-anhydromuramyl-L-alanine amidase AmpD